MVKLLLIGFILFSVSFIVSLLLRKEKTKEYIEPNEHMTLNDCLEMYWYDDRRVIVEDGKITEII